MKIIFDYFDDDRYHLAKRELLDPDMGLSDLGLQIRFNDYGSEIIIDDLGLGEIIRIEDARTFFGIYFVNGNCFEDLHAHAIFEIRFK